MDRSEGFNKKRIIDTLLEKSKQNKTAQLATIKDILPKVFPGKINNNSEAIKNPIKFNTNNKTIISNTKKENVLDNRIALNYNKIKRDENLNDR